MAARCPACAEPLGPRALFDAAPCSRCDGRVEAGQASTQLLAEVRKRGRVQVVGIALAVGAAHLVLGWVPLLGALALMLAAAWIRVGIAQPASALLGPRRRVLTRWTARLVMAAALAVTVIIVEALTLLPVFGLPIKALISSAEVVIVAWAVAAYVHWQVEREAGQLPIGTWEYVALGLCVGALLGAVLALALALAGLAAAFDSLLGWLR